MLKILLSVVFSLMPIVACADIRIIPPQSVYDSSHAYFSSLLKRVLVATQDEFGEEFLVYSLPMEQGRAIRELEQGNHIDVYWAGTSTEREAKLGVIKIPLLKGLLGYRVGIIRSDQTERLKGIQSFEQLKKLSVCQGSHWPDSDIMEASGLNVLRSPVYESMFKQVSFGRCDIFPRGVHEAYVEISVRDEAYPELVVFPELLIYYPFPMYFFTSTKDQQLQRRIEVGLTKMIKSGEFARFLREHPTTRHLFPLSNWINSKTFVIENPLLPAATDITNMELWVQPNLN